ncbi:MAG: hypothetical protein CVU88_08250 [Firmicutes bacterium HGW-Firmicutes-13]|nr:MAG: hypothetical protein CVU88_08250 [Firmicutes bacterium HGW-Firmicutes-13]
MLPGTVSYTLNHVLVLRLLMVGSFKKVKTLHNFLYLAASKNKIRDFPKPLIFIKLKSGVFNLDAQIILEELKKADYIEDTLSLNDYGRQLYYSYAPLLKYHKFPQSCLDMLRDYGCNLWQVNHEILFDPQFKKKRVGDKIIFQPLIKDLSSP